MSLSQLFTGRLVPPLLLGNKSIAVPVDAIPADVLVLPLALRTHGYRTGIVTSHVWFTEGTPLLDGFESRTIVPPGGAQSYAPFEELMPAITAFIDHVRTDPRPFFLYVHSLDTHAPNDYHPGFDGFRDAPGFPEPYNRYDAEIFYTDNWVHEVVEYLRRAGLLDRTVFAFTADHGEDLGELGPERWNRDHGLTVRRSLLHVPLIVRFPGDPARGRRYEGLTRHVDLAPTLMGLALPNVALDRYRVDGEDLSAELRQGGDGRKTARTSIGYSVRYWALDLPDLEVHYDQWENTFSPLYRPTPDAHNYPMLREVDDPPTRARLVELLGQEIAARSREELALPPKANLPDEVQIPVPTTVAADSAARPTFVDAPDDGRWTHLGALLACSPQETPAPITVSTRWVPGVYRIAISLHSSFLRQGYRDEFTIAFGDDSPRRIRGADADRTGWVDAGEHAIGRELVVTISAPEGGVAIGGFRLRHATAPISGPPDDETRRRLKALGYD
jgi:sulfatase-like protein